MKARPPRSTPATPPVDIANPSGDYPALILEEAQATELSARAVKAAPPDGTVRSVARNTLIMLVAQLITFAMTFIWTVALLHLLGTTNYGKLFTVQSLAWIGAVFMDAGVSTYLTKQVARDHAHTPLLLGAAYGLRLLSTVVVYLAILGVAVVLGYDQDMLLALGLIGGSIVVAAFTQATAATFQGHENMLWPALGTIAEKITVTVLSVVLLLLGYGLIAVAGVMLLGALANLVLVGGMAWRRWPVRPRFDPRLMVALLVGGAPFFLWASFGVIYQRNSALQLEALTDAATNGQFGAAIRMYETLSFVPYIFQTAVMPVLARTFVHSTNAMQGTARRSFDLILLAALPISAGVALLAPQIIELIAGATDYAGAVVPLRILGLSLLPLYLDMILATILISADKQRAWGSVAVLAALVNPLLNWWLIPITHRDLGNGAIGAAGVTLFTEVLIFCFYIFMVPRGVLGWSTALTAAKIGLAALGMSGVIIVLLPGLQAVAPGGGAGKLGAGVILVICAGLGAAVYAGLAWLLRVIGPAEVQLLRRALQRK
jgi:O-antigen/teichoic acid export membrane protein